MNEIVRLQREDCITIANSFLRDRELSNKAKGVLAMILALPPTWDFSIKGMVAITKDGEASFRSAINELRERGYCFRQAIRINGKIARWQYYFSGEEINESLLCGFQQVENQQVENQQVENQAQNNNILNNNNNKEDNFNENKKVENKFSTKKVFSKPTIQQVEEYIKSKNYHFDAEQFWNHYESVGWMIGKNHMKDWHCACATWEGRRKQERQEQAKKENIAANQGNMIDDAKWCGFQKWTFENVPKIHSLITSPMYREMVDITKNKSWVIADILTEINNHYYEGIEIMAEFNFIAQMDKYTQRINAV